MKKITNLFLLFTVIFSLSSCATIFTGTSQRIQISSNPPGAKVQIDGIDKGTTPLSVKLKKASDGPTITLKKEGYATKMFSPETSFNQIAFLNLFSPISWVIDLLTGATHKYDPKFYELELEKADK